MHPDVMTKLLENEPFSPFRLFLTDNRSFDVINPGLAYVTGTSVYLFNPVRRDSEGNSIIRPEPRIISLRQVVSLEPISSAA